MEHSRLICCSCQFPGCNYLNVANFKPPTKMWNWEDLMRHQVQAYSIPPLFQEHHPEVAHNHSYSHPTDQNFDRWLYLTAREAGKCSFQSTFSQVASVLRGKFRESYLMEEREDKLFETPGSLWYKGFKTEGYPVIGLPRWYSDAQPTFQCRRHKRHGFNPWVGKIPWSRKWQPVLVFLPGKFHGQRSLVVYSPWCHRVRHD